MTGGDNSGRNHDALDAVADFLKVTTSLAVGALVFGVGLLTAAATATWSARIAAIFSVLALFLSAFWGSLAYSRIPMLVAENDFSVHDKRLSVAGQWHQVTLLIGMLLLALSLAFSVFAIFPMSAVIIPDASEALSAAKKHLPAQTSITAVETIELIKGVDANNPSAEDWHVRLLTKTRPGSPNQTKDLYINARDGRVYE